MKIYRVIKCIYLAALFFSTYSYAQLSDDDVKSLLVCYKDKIDEAQSSEEKTDIISKNFPFENTYKLFIDMKRLQNPKGEERHRPPHLIFDVEEPGYFESMIDAYIKMDGSIGRKITLADIIELHDLAVGKVAKIQKGLYQAPVTYVTYFDSRSFSELFRSGILYYPGIFIRSLSQAPLYGSALEAIAMRFFKNERDEYLSEWLPESRKIESKYRSQEHLALKLNPIIEHYYESINKTERMSERLSAIAELLRALEVAHFFRDGNQRTYAFLLLPKLLLENGIPPAILDEPTMFDGYMSVKKMTASLKKGVINFLNESADRQRVFLTESCSKVNATTPKLSAWLSNENKYQPYYTLQTPLVKIKAHLYGIVTNALQTGNLNQKVNDFYPLQAAIFLGKHDLVTRLIERGAAISDAIGLTLRLGNLDLAKYLIQAAAAKEPEIFDNGFLASALILSGYLSENAALLAPDKQTLVLEVMDQLLSLPAAKKLDSTSLNYLLQWADKIESLKEMRRGFLKKYDI